jgi:hypothetical protein
MRALSVGTSFALTLALLASACGQEVVAPPCTDHDAAPPGDAGPTSDAASADAGPLGPDAEAGDAGPRDAVAQDASPSDAGNPACPGRYCLTALVASSTRVDVREVVTLTPTVDNPGGQALTFSASPAELVGARRPGRPAVVLSELGIQLDVDAATGVTTFRITEVPPWFMATTFRVRVRAEAAGGPSAYAEAEVHVRGNTVYSGTYSDRARVYAVASDGRPARATGPGLTSGELITQLARAPAALLLSRDGSLLVHDSGGPSSPPRLLRFELTGHDQQLARFAEQDAQGQVLLDRDPTYPYSLAELPDGRVALVDYDFSRSPKSRVLLYAADGGHSATFVAPEPLAIWTGIGVGPGGELLVTRLDGGGRVERLDPATGVALGVLVDGLPSSARAVLGRPDGSVYVSGDGYVVRTAGAQRSLVGVLPGSTSAPWRILAPGSDGHVLAANDELSDSAAPVVVDGRTVIGPLRRPGAGNISTTLRGMAYLE